MNINLRILIILAVIIASQWHGQAQNNTPQVLNYKYNTWSIGLNYGMLVSFGEIKQNSFLPAAKEAKSGMGLTLEKQLSSTVGARFQTLLGTLYGTKRELNQYSRTELNEFTLNLTFSLNNLLFPKKDACKLKAYGVVGYGFSSFRSAFKQNNNFVMGYGYNNRGIATDLTNEWVMPIGFGLKYKVSDNIDLGIETNFKITNSDKIDAFVVKGSSSDKYQYTSFTVNYKIGNGRYQLEWLSSKQRNTIDQFLIDSIYKIKNINDTILTLYFNKNEYDISLENEVKLMKVIQYLNANPTTKIKVIGYFDINGEPKYNDQNNNIAASRSMAVSKLLIEKYAIAKNRICRHKKSESMFYPLSTVSNPNNRRVEIIVRTPKMK